MHKQTKLFATSTLLAAGLGGVAMAQSASGFYMDGYLTANYVSTGTSVTHLGDITLGYDGIGGMPLGMEVNLLEFGGGSSVEYALTGGIYYDTDFGRFTVGQPRPAVDDYLAEISLGNSAQMNYTGLSYIRSVTQAQMVLNPSDFKYGARFDGSFNGIDYGISLHALNPDGVIVTAGASYDFGQYYTLGAGIERIPGILADDMTYFASIKADYGNFGGSFLIRNDTGMLGTVYNANAYYDWNNLEVFVDYMGDASGGYHNIGVEYTFMDNGYVGVENIGNGTTWFSNNYNIYAGWSFSIGG